jgi:hypothetical protein
VLGELARFPFAPPFFDESSDFFEARSLFADSAFAETGGLEGGRPAPISSIAAMRAAFVSAGSSGETAPVAGTPPFCCAGAGFERGFEMGVPSGARRTM